MEHSLNQQADQKRTLGFLALSILILSILTLSCLPSAGQQQKEKLSKKELKTLIATARTPEDHLRLAAYYRAQANEYFARQKQHQADAEVYDSNPSQYPTKPISAGQHCRDWAGNDGRSAKQALALAEMHEAMARTAAR